LFRAFGLNVDSDLENQSLDYGARVLDVEIRLGKVPETLPNAHHMGPIYQVAPASFLLKLHKIARYLVLNGSQICIEPEPEASPDAVRLFLFGSVFGALLHQRGLLPLHGSAIQTRRGAVVIAGASGSGKSTIACAFSRRGYSVLTDEIAAIETGDSPVVLPGHPFLLLWADALRRMKLESAPLAHVRPGLEKFILPLGERFAKDPMPLHAIYVIEPTNFELSGPVPVKGLRKIETLIQNTYRPRFVEHMKLEQEHIKQITSVAERVPVARISRPRHGFAVEQLVDLLERHLDL
jgi:hypothetical protein